MNNVWQLCRPLFLAKRFDIRYVTSRESNIFELYAKWTRHRNLLVLINCKVEYFHGQLRVEGKLDFTE